ncbi:MAG: hypothetical protein ACRCSL_06625 [Microbacterium sp.]
MRANDAVGTWRAGSNLPAQLELAKTGFTATDWPLAVGCGGEKPRAVQALEGSEIVDFTGTREEGEGGSLNAITLYPDGDARPA